MRAADPMVALALALSAQTAYSFAPSRQLAVRSQPLAPRGAATLLQPDAMVARPLRTAKVSMAASMPAAAPAGVVGLTRSAIFRLASALVCTLATLLLTASRALAVSATKSAASSAAPVDMVKWGGIGLFAGAMFMMNGGNDGRGQNGFQYVEEDEAPKQQKAPVAVALPEDGAGEPEEADDGFGSLDFSDGALSGALSARMQALAQEKLEQNDEEQDEEPDDSTDEWGMGSTAVLEPPRPDAPNPDDGPDFPVGFPLRDFEEADAPQPAASESDIAMLNRMFGTSN